MTQLLETPVLFDGGVALPQHPLMKSLELCSMSLPQRLFLPLRQHHGMHAKPVVRVGERVLKGQCVARASGYISAAVHASSSGTVTDIDEYPVPRPSAQPDVCVVIECDGTDEVYPQEEPPVSDFHRLSALDIQQRLLNAGVVGMGGAGFPTAVKMIPALGKSLDLFIVNAVECEPWINCDDAAVQNYAQKLITGIEIIRHAVAPAVCVVGIKQTMPAATRECLESAISTYAEDEIEVREVVPHYPAGGERQLVKALTGQVIPDGGLPIDINILMHNVGTVIGVYDAIILGQPTIERIVTVSGEGITAPANLEARLGTPAIDLIMQCGGFRDGFDEVIMGGPMMGYRLQSLDVPITKSSNCLLVKRKEPSLMEMPCIGCNQCVSACPENLFPHLLLSHAREMDMKSLQEERLFSCTECGCCSYVCPSHIPLVDVYRQAKHSFWEYTQQQEKAQLAGQRYQARQQRLGESSEDTMDTAQVEPVLTQAEKQEVINAAVVRVNTRRNK